MRHFGPRNWRRPLTACLTISLHDEDGLSALSPQSRSCRGCAANYDAAVAGPTSEERAIADAQVQAAAAVVAVLERRLDKMVLRAPADGVDAGRQV